jgi:hypothetical protein
MRFQMKRKTLALKNGTSSFIDFQTRFHTLPPSEVQREIDAAATAPVKYEFTVWHSSSRAI